jgi:hypothetical protein
VAASCQKQDNGNYDQMIFKMIFKRFFFILSAVFFSCGIPEYFYLPQIPESNVKTALNTNAEVSLPAISDDYYYAGSYTIFYRIYVSNENLVATSSAELSQISSALLSDYTAFSQITNPANTSAITSSNTFRNRNYFELEFEGVDIASILPKSGGTLRIIFPTSPWDYPVATINDGQEYRLRRSTSQLTSPEPRDDLFFRNTQELRFYQNANSNINADVAGRSGEMQYAYVSMYIVAVGANPVNFTSIYSKPTHISVFKLTDTN